MATALTVLMGGAIALSMTQNTLGSSMGGTTKPTIGMQTMVTTVQSAAVA